MKAKTYSNRPALFPPSAFSLQPSSLPSRLWLGGFGVLLFLLTMIVGLHVANPRNSPLSRLPGDDLVPSYMAGTFVRQGRADLLMDFPAAVRFQADLRRREHLEQ